MMPRPDSGKEEERSRPADSRGIVVSNSSSIVKSWSMVVSLNLLIVDSLLLRRLT